MSLLVCPFGNWREIFVDYGRDLTCLQYPLSWEVAPPPSSSQPRRIAPRFQSICRTMWPFITLLPFPSETSPGKITCCSRKRKKWSTFPSPKETRNYTYFSKALIPGAWRGAWRPGEISHQRIQDDDNFQHDQKCNWRNGCFAIQKLSHSLTGLYPCFQ